MPFLQNLIASNIAEEQARFMARVYLWMCSGLTVTGFTAYATFLSPLLLAIIFKSGFVFLGLIILQFVLVATLSGLIEKVSDVMAKLIFFAYCMLNGFTFSVIFLAYNMQSIITVFGLTAGMFAGLSAYGYLTKRDLSPWGSFLVAGLWGLILLGVFNLFFYNGARDLIISCMGLFIFAGLTAYDTQKIKALNVIGNEGTEEDTKEAIYGALILYLDFINLFLKLLRLTGRRRS